MTRWHRRLARLSLVAVVLVLSGRGIADEGFWLFNAPPKAAISQALGFELTDGWLTRMSSARR